MTLTLEHVRCNLCDHDDYDIYLIREDLNTFLPGEFQLVSCRNCGLVYQNPSPTINSFNTIYPIDYDQSTESIFRDTSRISRFSRLYGLRKQSKAIIRHKKKGRLLDVGCSTGNFLEIMNTLSGWELHGIEPNPHASEYARNQLGLNVITGLLDDVEYPEEHFDVITLWHVLEHLNDPSKTLQRLQKLLKPDGLLVITTPNLDSFDARIFGKYWIGYELPRHYYVFSLESLDDILRQAGFKLLETRYIYGSHAAFMSSLRFWLRGQKISSGLRSVTESVLFSPPTRVLTSPYFFIADRLKLSSAPTTFYVKVS